MEFFKSSLFLASCMVCKAQVDAEVIREDIFNQKIPVCKECPEQDVEALLSGMTGNQNTNNDTHMKSSSSTSDPAVATSSDSSQPPSTSTDDQIPSTSCADPSTTPSTSSAPPPSMSQPSLFTTVPVMKPDIVFFGEGLPDHFHNSITR